MNSCRVMVLVVVMVMVMVVLVVLVLVVVSSHLSNYAYRCEVLNKAVEV